MSANEVNRVVRMSSFGGIEAVAAGPCPRCAVRADVGCKHRPAEGVPPVAVAQADPKPKWGRRNRGQGLGFHRDELARNLERAGTLLGLEVRHDRHG